MKLTLTLVGVLVALLVAVSYAALEAGGVAIVETEKADGTTRTTHVWFMQERGLWLEGGSAGNGWVTDVEQTGELTLSMNAKPFRYKATISTRPRDRGLVRIQMRRKYGWRDWWVGLFVDHEKSVAVQLHGIQ